MFFLTQTSWINNAYICYYINELPITLLFTISTHFVHFHSSFGKLLDYALSNSSPPSYNIIDHNNTNGGKGWGKVASFIFLHQMPSDLSNLHIEGGKRLCRLKNGKSQVCLTTVSKTHFHREIHLKFTLLSTKSQFVWIM